MKITSLLLSSAAVLVAGSAFAADLPAKKAAPAAAVVACPAFGAGFFQLPGSDTCLKLSGYMNYTASYNFDESGNTTAAYGQAGEFRVMFDARSNTELGVVRGFSRVTQGTVDRAFVQFSGITAGLNSSLSDFAGTNAWQYGSSLGAGAGGTVRYDAALGASTLSIAIENAQNNNSEDAEEDQYVTDRPDLLVGFKTTLGMVDLNIVAASHEVQEASVSDQGYAVLGRIGASLGGGFGVALFGGISEGASKYTYDGGEDLVGGELAEGTNIGGEILLTAGKGVLALAADQATFEQGATDITRTNYGVSYVYELAKGLSIEPEIVMSSVDDGTDTTDSTIAYLRIQRDF